MPTGWSIYGSIWMSDPLIKIKNADQGVRPFSKFLLISFDNQIYTKVTLSLGKNLTVGGGLAKIFAPGWVWPSGGHLVCLLCFLHCIRTVTKIQENFSKKRSMKRSINKLLRNFKMKKIYCRRIGSL